MNCIHLTSHLASVGSKLMRYTNLLKQERFADDRAADETLRKLNSPIVLPHVKMADKDAGVLTVPCRDRRHSFHGSKTGLLAYAVAKDLLRQARPEASRKMIPHRKIDHTVHKIQQESVVFYCDGQQWFVLHPRRWLNDEKFDAGLFDWRRAANAWMWSAYPGVLLTLPAWRQAACL